MSIENLGSDELNNLNSLGDIVQLCGFKIGKDYYAISVLEVQEVVRPQELTKIPMSPPYIKGLMNLRGQIVTSISLRGLFGLAESEKADYMNIIVRSEESLYALQVDEILDVMDVDNATYEKTPDNLQEKIRQYIAGVHKLDGRLLVVLDLVKVLSLDNE